MSAEAQAAAILIVDLCESDGRPGRPYVLNDRPMALHDPSGVWYGFFVVQADRSVIDAGESARVEIYFLNDEEATRKFPLDMPIRFGNGVTTRGTLVVERWLPSYTPSPPSTPYRLQARATIKLPPRNADGGTAQSLQPQDRPLAITEEGAFPFGFVAFAPHASVISPGESVQVQMCFLDDVDARHKIPLAIPIPICTDGTQRGTLVIEQWLPSLMPKPIYPDALATLSVDNVDSKGRPGNPVTAKLRPIVRRVDGSSWYSFVMTDAAQTIDVGDTSTVAIAFVNPEDARIDFPEGTRTVFGDGPAIFGSFVLERWLDAG